MPQIVYLRRPEEQPGVYTVTLPAPAPEPRIRVPERLLTPPPKPQPRSVDAEDVDPATWRYIELLAWKPDEETCEIWLLRPTWWIEQAGAKVGGLIRLSMPEMGVDGPAKVLLIGPCPPAKPGGPGTRRVTGKFKHRVKSILHLHLSGMDKPIGVTPNHPIYSLDRGEFVPAGKLKVGERLKTHSGVSAVVTQVVTVPGERFVYNLEVHRDHVYYVSNLGVLVHNACEFFPNPKDALGMGGQDAVMVPRSEVKVRNPALAAQGFTLKRIYKMVTVYRSRRILPGARFRHNV